MLRSASRIIGYRLEATDGSIGSIHDLSFDDKTWTIRYIVADTGRWLPGRKVLLSPVSFGSPDWKDKTIPISMNKKQIENSPSIDADKTVSREHEIELHKYYGWPPYWGAYPIGGIGWIPVPMQDVSEEKAVTEDSNLRSVREVIRYAVASEDGETGHVEDFIFDDESWIIRYTVVSTREWIPGKMVLVSPEWIKQIDWNSQKVHLGLTRESIKNAPEFDPSAAPVNRQYEEKLHDYFGKPKYWR